MPIQSPLSVLIMRKGLGDQKGVRLRGEIDSSCLSYRLNFRKEVRDMCINCGCGMPDNDMGNPKLIINKTFEEAAKAAGQSVEEAKKNVYEHLKKEMEKKKK
jgi:hypothetical protein